MMANSLIFEFGNFQMHQESICQMTQTHELILISEMKAGSLMCRNINVLNFNKNFNYLQPFLLIPSAFLLIIHPLFLSNHFLTNDLSLLFITHIAIALLAYSLFTFSAYLAIFILIFEKKLHQKKKIDMLLSGSQPLIEMENFLFNINKIGFLLLTITLISGILFSEQVFGTPLQFNHKTVFSILAWLIYGLLLVGKRLYGWRGRNSIYISLTAFVFLLLS